LITLKVPQTGIELCSLPRSIGGFQFFFKGSATNDATFFVCGQLLTK